MEISVIEVVLRNAVQRGVLDEAEVNEALDQMWGRPRDVSRGYEDASDKASRQGKQDGRGHGGVLRSIGGRGRPLEQGS